MPIDVIVYALVAVGLILWLRSLLGMRQDGERQRPNPFADNERLQPQKKAADGKSRLLGLPIRPNATDATAGKRPVLAQHMTIRPAATDGVAAVGAADKYFNAAEFLQGAQDAFIIIVEAFAAGNRDTLRPLLDDQLYAAFDAAIGQREKDGHKNSVEIHAVRSVELINAWLDKKSEFVTVKFVADETTATIGSGDAVIAGNPDRIVEASDIWTFARTLKSKGPEWLLVRTQEEEAGEIVIPDAGAAGA